MATKKQQISNKAHVASNRKATKLMALISGLSFTSNHLAEDYEINFTIFDDFVYAFDNRLAIVQEFKLYNKCSKPLEKLFNPT